MSQGQWEDDPCRHRVRQSNETMEWTDSASHLSRSPTRSSRVEQYGNGNGSGSGSGDDDDAAEELEREREKEKEKENQNLCEGDVCDPPASSSSSKQQVCRNGKNFVQHLSTLAPWAGEALKLPIRVVDYLPSFPQPMDANFQTLISNKREFAMLHSRSGEKIEDGDYYPQQKFVRLFLEHYDRLFLVSEPGTGKTCSVASFCEYVVRLRHFNIANSMSKLKRFVIVVRSPFHIENIKNMIRKVCSANFYDTHRGDFSKASGAKRRRTSTVDAEYLRRLAYKNMTHVGYEFLTYRGLAKLLNEKYLNSRTPNVFALRQRFADTLLWIDEAHNIALSANQLLNRKHHVKEDTYWAIHRLCHEVEKMKIVLTTATPMLNDAAEMISLVNLLRPEDGRPPHNWDWRETDDETFAFRFPEAAERNIDRKVASWSSVVPHFIGQMNPRLDIKTMDLSHLEQHFRGIFVYSRQDAVGVKVTYVGQPGRVNLDDEVSKKSLPGKMRGKLTLYQSKMSLFQSRSFDKVYRGMTEDNFFFQQSRNVSNFMFPKGDVKEGFDRYMSSSSSGMYKATNEFDGYLSDMSNIRKSSCKFHKIVQLCMGEPGNCFVYGEHVKGSGLYVLAACLEAQGVKRYSDTTPVIDPSTGAIKEPLASTSVMRYALFTGDNQTNYANVLDLMNCSGNSQGRYIKIFISSKIGREGISVKNAQQIHLVSPEWTSSGIFQATSRGIRADAHRDLSRALGGSREVEVKVYLHCAVSACNNSIDRNMYFTAERKDEGIQRVLTVAKRVAVNTQLDYDKNVRPGDSAAGMHYVPADPWAKFGSDESSFKLYMYSIVASYIKDSILHNLHSSSEIRGRSGGCLDVDVDVAVAGSSAADDLSQKGVQTLSTVVNRFSKVYSNATMSYAIQWKLRDKVHCMDIYARPGRIEISRGLVYYSTCIGVNSPNYSDVIMGVRVLSLLDMMSKSEEMYFKLVVSEMEPNLMTADAFAKILRNERLSTSGSIYLIEAIIQHTMELFGVDSLDLWDTIETASREAAVLESSSSTVSQDPSSLPSHRLLHKTGRYILRFVQDGIDVTEYGSHEEGNGCGRLDAEDVEEVRRHAILKYWYVIKMYRSLLFKFKEPVSQLDEWYAKYTKMRSRGEGGYGGLASASHTSHSAERGLGGMKRALGKQHSTVKKIWSTSHSADNETLNATMGDVLVHILHVLDEASTPYSIVPRIGKAECRTRVLHLSEFRKRVGWRDVTNKEFYTYNPIVQSLFNMHLINQSKRGIHGIVYGESFRICEPDPTIDLSDLRRRKKGKLCRTISSDKLKFILASMNVKPSPDLIVEYLDAKKRKETNPLRSRRPAGKIDVTHTSRLLAEVESDMTADQFNIYEEWLDLKGMTTATLCAIVKKAMVRANKVLYYNIKMM